MSGAVTELNCIASVVDCICRMRIHRGLNPINIGENITHD